MIRIATVGTSKITRSFIDAAASVPEVSVTTVFSRDGKRAAEFAADAGVPGYGADLDQVLSSPDVDAMYIASPNGIHGEQVLQAIRAGKHALVEKPAVPTAAEFERVTEAAAEAGVIVLEAMRNCYDPGLTAVGELARADLGAVRRASFAYCQRSARYDKVLAGERVNIFDPALAGGALMDLGVYTVAAMVQLFGEPDQVFAASVPIPGGADGSGAALTVHDGFLVDLAYSKITASDRVNEIQGERGTLTFDHVAQPTSARVSLLDGTVTEHSFEGPANNMVHEVRRFADLVAGSGDPSSDHARTMATLRVVEEIQDARDQNAQRGC
ncbi:Gfo/Idh/MocA family oxidoreductase [Gordonia sp. SID5947]|uniref:Gfo/Idh/MocA family protein n=1 Tax=Gordonia sp. SID5947 TaxID=2690315 RepID=UPI001371E128|nr:Gfo/Idh/MocA family oxidoreductase [Gordonia sp. SID5947]MYR08248.1 Gfo/Idh/MocA family oxidoreductase [Gordonia sp. SID5947]